MLVQYSDRKNNINLFACLQAYLTSSPTPRKLRKYMQHDDLSQLYQSFRQSNLLLCYQIILDQMVRRGMIHSGIRICRRLSNFPDNQSQLNSPKYFVPSLDPDLSIPCPGNYHNRRHTSNYHAPGKRLHTTFRYIPCDRLGCRDVCNDNTYYYIRQACRNFWPHFRQNTTRVPGFERNSDFLRDPAVLSRSNRFPYAVSSVVLVGKRKRKKSLLLQRTVLIRRHVLSARRRYVSYRYIYFI